MTSDPDRPEQWSSLGPGWNDVDIVYIITLFMKDGSSAKVLVDDPRIDIDELMSRDRIRTTNGQVVLLKNELKSYFVETITNIIPSGMEEK